MLSLTRPSNIKTFLGHQYILVSECFPLRLLVLDTFSLYRMFIDSDSEDRYKHRICCMLLTYVIVLKYLNWIKENLFEVLTISRKKLKKIYCSSSLHIHYIILLSKHIWHNINCIIIIIIFFYYYLLKLRYLF